MYTIDKFGRFIFNSQKEKDDFLLKFKTENDFQEFIDSNNILSKRELIFKFYSFKTRAVKLGVWDLLKFKLGVKRSLNKDIDKYNTKEDFQNYIKIQGIKTRREFQNSSRLFYKKAKDLNILEELVFPGLIKLNHNDFNTLEDFQKLADKYETLKEFNQNHADLLRRFKYLKKKGKISGELIFKLSEYEKVTHYNDSYKTKEEFEQFIKDNNIKSPKEFEFINHSLYKRMLDLNITIEYENKHDNRDLKIDDYSKYNTLLEIQDFVIKYKCYSRIELKNTAKTIYRRYLKLRKELNKDIIFIKTSGFESISEWKAIKELIKFNIKNYKLHFRIDSEDKQIRFFDILLPELKIIIEVHGSQHFSKARPGHWDERDEIKNDRFKFELAKSTGYQVYYVTYDSWYLYKKHGYFQPVYKSVRDILNSIGIDLTENQNFKQDLMNIFSDDFIGLVNKICQEFKIHNFEELKKFDNLFLLVQETNCENSINYYIDC